jgi:hypothetical protein
LSVAQGSTEQIFFLHREKPNVYISPDLEVYILLPNMFPSNRALPLAVDVRFLGVLLDNKLLWKLHYDGSVLTANGHLTL